MSQIVFLLKSGFLDKMRGGFCQEKVLKWIIDTVISLWEVSFQGERLSEIEMTRIWGTLEGGSVD